MKIKIELKCLDTFQVSTDSSVEEQWPECNLAHKFRSQSGYYFLRIYTSSIPGDECSYFLHNNCSYVFVAIYIFHFINLRQMTIKALTAVLLIYHRDTVPTQIICHMTFQQYSFRVSHMKISQKKISTITTVLSGKKEDLF